MNKIYKLVYSKALNQVVAVSEIAKKAQPGSVNKTVDAELLTAEAPVAKGQLNRLALTFVLGSLFSALPMGAAQANTNSNERVNLGEVATAVASNDATATKSLNAENIKVDGTSTSVKYVGGVPVIDIANPNAAGVSDNRFSKFSTSTGAVFNNLKNGSVAVDSFVLQQKLAANSQLQNAAKVILAQVTGNDKSVIKGTLEILGQKADLIVINPNGIDLNGVHLVNQGAFTASTAEIASNNHLVQTINKGEINVNGVLTSDDVDVIRLIAAAVKVKAQISPLDKNGKKANIVVAGGKQTFDLSTNKGTKLDSDKGSSADQKVVISGDVLGSMYGSKINFVVSESGAGVSYDGMIIGEDDLTITADGQIKVNNFYAKGDVKIASAKGDVNISDKGSVKSLNKIQISGKSVNTAKATLQATKEVKVDAAQSLTVGEVQADSIQLSAATNIITEANTAIKANNVVADATTITFDGKLEVNQDVTIGSDKTALVTFNSEGSVAGNASINAKSILFAGVLTKVDTDNPNFKFNKLNLKFETNNSSSLMLSGSTLLTNDLEISGVTGISLDNLSNAVLAANGGLQVLKSTSLDLSGVQLDSAAKVEQTTAFTKQFGSALTKFTADSLKVTSDEVLNLDRAYSFYVADFSNEGIIVSNASTAISTTNNYFDNGLTVIKGDYVVDAKKDAKFNGNLYVYADLTVSTPTLNQSGLVQVGGDFTLNADKYNLTTEVTGSVAIEQGGKVFGNQWHYHALRKDRYEITSYLGQVTQGTLEFNTVETNVAGDFSFKAYNPTAEKPASFFIENGRFYVGGNANIDGNLDVRTSTYKVKVKDLLNYQQRIEVDFQPVSLINTNLAREHVQQFPSLFSFLDSLATGDVQKRNSLSYKILPDQIYKTFATITMDSTMNQVISAVLGADWKGIDFSTFKQRWSNYVKNQDKYEVGLYAPSSEMFVAGKYTQNNGSLYVGSDDEQSKVVETTNFAGKYGALVTVESGSDVLIAQKISGIRKADHYYNALSKLIKQNVDGSYTLNENAPSWVLGTGNIQETIYNNFNDVRVNSYQFAGDNKFFSALVVEQYKDLVGGYLTIGKTAQSIVNDLIKATETRSAVVKTAKWGAHGTVTATIDSVEKTFANASTYVDYLNTHYSYIGYTFDASGKVIPKVVLSTDLKSKATNFDQVAASLSAVEAIEANVASAKIINASLNTKALKLTATGDIDLQAVAGQNSINSATTDIRTGGNFSSVGNLNVGNFTLDAVGDADFSAVAFFTDEGYLNHQGLIKADKALIEAENLKMEAAKLHATDSLKIEVTGDIDMDATHNIASDYSSVVDENDASARQIQQAAAFVTGSEIVGKNVDIKAGGDLSMESSTIKAVETANIEVENIENTAKADVKHVEAKEYKTQLIGSASASFGAAEASVTKQFAATKNVEGKEDPTLRTKLTTKGEATKGAAATTSLGLATELTQIKIDTVKHQNNELNAQELNVKVRDHAELGNTNINNDGAIKVEDLGKVANIEAGSIDQHQQTDITDLNTKRERVSFGLTLSTDSSVLDAASNLISTARAKSMGLDVDGSYAATLISDLTGLQNRDTSQTSLSLKFGYEKDTATQVTYSDSSNKMAGIVNIKTEGDTRLKAVQGIVKELNIKADNISIEGGQSQTESKFGNVRAGLSLDLTAGANKRKGDATLSLTVAASYINGETEAVHQQHSQIAAQNVNLEASDTVSLKNTIVNVLENAKVKAETIDIQSDQDTIKSSSAGGGAQATIGFSVVTLVPYGSIGGYGERHTQDTQLTMRASGISAGNQLNVESENLNLKAGVISGQEGSTVNVKNITVTNNEDRNVIQGGKFGLSIGGSITGAVVGSINGGKDRSTYLEQVVTSTISDKVAVNEDAVGLADVNRDINEIAKVRKNKVTQETNFDFTITSGNVQDMKKVSSAIKSVVADISTGTSSLFSANAAFQKGYNDPNAVNAQSYAYSSYNTSTQSINCNCNYDINGSTQQTLNPLSYSSTGSTSTSGGSSASGSSSSFSLWYGAGSTNRPGVNKYSTVYSTGFSGIGNGAGSIYDPTMLQNYIEYNFGGSALGDQESTFLQNLQDGKYSLESSVFGNALNGTPSAYAAERQAGSDGVRYFETGFNEVRLGNIRDVNFGTTLTGTTNTADDSNYYTIGGNGKTSANQGGSNNSVTPVIIVDNGSTNNGVTTVINDKPFTNGDSSSNTDQGSSGSSTNGSTGTGTGANSSTSGSGNSSIGSGNGSFGGNTDGSYESSDSGRGNSSSNTGVTDGVTSGANTGANGSSSSNGTTSGTGTRIGGEGYGSGTNFGTGVDLETSGGTVSSNTKVDGTNDGNFNLGGNTTGATVNGSTDVVVDQDGDVLGFEQIGGGSTTSLVDKSSSTSISNSENTSVVSSGDNAANGSGTSTTTNGGESDGSDSTVGNNTSGQGSSANGTNEDTADTATKTDTGTTTIEKDASSQQESIPTPADGNAKEGEIIPVGQNTSVVKYQLGDLSCYVLSNNAGAAHTGKELVKGTSGAAMETFAESGLSGAARPRTTLFSTYSKGIEDNLGDNGVICIPTTAEVLKTDYNVVTASTVIPIVKSASEKLDAVVVTERKIVKVRMNSNNSVAAQAAPVRVSASIAEISSIKSALSEKGIDASKVMILGVKGGTTAEGIANLVRNASNQKLQGVQSALKAANAANAVNNVGSVVGTEVKAKQN